MRLVLPDAYRSSDDSQRAFFSDLVTKLEALPGVRTAAGASQMPFSGGRSYPPTSVDTPSGVVETTALVSSVTPDYFKAMSIPVLAGRPLNAGDRQGAAPVAVVNKAMANRYWPGESPLGRRLKFGGSDDSDWLSVVGVVGDVRYLLPENPPTQMYVPFSQNPRPYLSLVYRADIDPAGTAAAAQAAVWSLDSEIPAQVDLLDDRIRRSTAVAKGRFSIAVLGTLAGAAALLASLGVYGVLAYSVASRRREIGIRLALGAGRRAVIRGVMQRGLTLLAAGLAIGLAGTLLTVRFLESLLFSVSPTDAANLADVALLVTVAALAAGFLPALRATRVYPVEALRSE